jgi:hypothetical protein
MHQVQEAYEKISASNKYEVIIPDKWTGIPGYGKNPKSYNDAEHLDQRVKKQVIKPANPI